VQDWQLSIALACIVGLYAGSKYAMLALWWWLTDDDIKIKLLSQGSPAKYRELPLLLNLPAAGGDAPKGGDSGSARAQMRNNATGGVRAPSLPGSRPASRHSSRPPSRGSSRPASVDLGWRPPAESPRVLG
jgi:hypothetical protein